MEVKISEVEVQKLNLQPGEVLIVKVRSDEVDAESLYRLSEGFKSLIPNNKVAVMAVGENGSIDLTVVSEAEYHNSKAQGCGPTPADYCNNCSCGKKEAFERKGE